MNPDAAVVGAGPAGILAATTVSSRGFDATVYEEHSAVGEPNHCAGLLSVEGLEKLGVEPSDDFVQNRVYGGRVYAPDGEFLEIRDRRPRAYVVDRGRFDRYLADAAADAGVEFRLGTRVERLLFLEGSCMGVVVDGAGVKSWLVVDAEGPGGRLLGRSGIETHQKGFVMGYNTVLEGVEVDPEMVELWFSEELAKGFFAWVIPIDGNRVRCGLGTSGGDGYESLRAFIKKRFGIGEPPRVGSGLICTGPPVDKTTYNGLLLTGDAAGQVKATTGGGVVIGGLCAQIAGEEAAEALTSGDASWGRLSEYDRRWRRLYGGELRTMHAARRLMNKVGDERFNRLMASLKESGLQSRLEELVSGGDMDLQSGVIKKALMNPGIMSVMLRGVGSVALGELLSMLR